MPASTASTKVFTRASPAARSVSLLVGLRSPRAPQLRVDAQTPARDSAPVSITNPQLIDYARRYAEIARHPLWAMSDKEARDLIRKHVPVPLGKNENGEDAVQGLGQLCRFDVLLDKSKLYYCVAFNLPDYDHLTIFVQPPNRFIQGSLLKPPVKEVDVAKTCDAYNLADLTYLDRHALHSGLLGLYLPSLTLDFVGCKEGADIACRMACETLRTDVPYMKLAPTPAGGGINVLGCEVDAITYWTYRDAHWASSPNLWCKAQVGRVFNSCLGNASAKAVLADVFHRQIEELLTK